MMCLTVTALWAGRPPPCSAIGRKFQEPFWLRDVRMHDAESKMGEPSQNRVLNSGQVFLSGLVLGITSYLVAEFLVPSTIESPGDHDLLLANRLGLIYTPVVGLWLGWVQRSWRQALIGALVGGFVGVLYLSLNGRNFLAVMVGFPCLCGGVFSMLAGSNRDPWVRGLGARLGKGLAAGFVLGFVYMVVLNIAGAMLSEPWGPETDPTAAYVAMMWKAGPVALGLSSGLFLLLVRWAVGLTRIRILVLEETSATTGSGQPPGP